MNDIKVFIYFGPLSWFQHQPGVEASHSLMELALELDEAGRIHTHVFPGDDSSTDGDAGRDRPESVQAESGDFASLSEHVVSNFVGLIRRINPKRVHIHNPPARVRDQLRRAFGATDVRYSYPQVTRETLTKIRSKFGQHLVGQEAVKERLLAALYPLSRPGRIRPVVLMFYGPSGVGKTETAQFVNNLIGGILLRKQFSMFHSDKFASYLFGGSHSEPSFAHDLLDRESGVVLIDEFDKANRMFHSAFYQLFDGGEFEDKNYKVHVGPTLIICTSNYASEREVRDSLGDALYSRFDAVIEFLRLGEDDMLAIVDRVMENRFAELTEEESDLLDRPFLRERMRASVHSGGNVRRLRKTVDEAISIMLVRALVEEESDPPPTVQVQSQ